MVMQLLCPCFSENTYMMPCRQWLLPTTTLATTTSTAASSKSTAAAKTATTDHGETDKNGIKNKAVCVADTFPPVHHGLRDEWRMLQLKHHQSELEFRDEVISMTGTALISVSVCWLTANGAGCLVLQPLCQARVTVLVATSQQCGVCFWLKFFQANWAGLALIRLLRLIGSVSFLLDSLQLPGTLRTLLLLFMPDIQPNTHHLVLNLFVPFISFYSLSLSL